MRTLTALLPAMLFAVPALADAPQGRWSPEEYFVPPVEKEADDKKGGDSAAADAGRLTRFRGQAELMLLVDEPGRVTLDLACVQVSRRYDDRTTFSVRNAAGETLASGRMDPGEEERVSLDVAEPAVLMLEVDSRHNSFTAAVDGARMTLQAAPGSPCHVFRGSGRLWFYVPHRSRGFSVHVRGFGLRETASVEVFNPEGRKVAEGSTAGSDRCVVHVPPDAEQDEAVWSLQIVRAPTGTLEDASFRLEGDVSQSVALRRDELAVPMMRLNVPHLLRKGESEGLAIDGVLLAAGCDPNPPEISFVVAQDGREVARRRAEFHDPPAFRATLPTDALATGKYRMTSTFRIGGRVVSVRRSDLFVVEGPKRLRDDGVLVEEGEPFFARGLYHVHPKDYETIRKQGFNTVQASPGSVPACGEAGIRAAVALYFGMRVDETYYREQIGKHRDNPAVVAWMIMDEPAAHGTPLEKIENAYGVIRQEDPARPAYMCICRPDAYTTYGMATDVLAIDVYPIREQAQDITRIGQTLAIAQRDVPEQAVWFIGQVWSWPGRDDPDQRRLVTPAEHRAMTYYALTYGNVKGLMWYSFRDPDWYLPESNPAVWKQCKQVNDELEQLERVWLATPKWQREVETAQGPTIRATLRIVDGTGYLLVVNPTSDKARAEIAILEAADEGELTMLFDERSAVLENGSVRATMRPLDVQLYRFRAK